MARRRKPSRRNGVSSVLRRARLQLRKNNVSHATTLAEEASDRATTESERQAATQMLVEIHFQAATTATSLGEALQHIDAALEYRPQAAGLHLFRGITLWRSDHVETALEAFEKVSPSVPEAFPYTYLYRLAQIASGEQPTTFNSEALTVEERTTLHLVNALVDDAPASEINALLDEPLLAGDTGVWTALIEMQRDEDAAPFDTLQRAAEAINSKHVSALLRAYRGIAAHREGNSELARTMWESALKTGKAPRWVEEILGYMLREDVIALSEEGRWDEIAAVASNLRIDVDDRILAETIGLAYFHLGYDEAQNDDWRSAAQHWRTAETYVSNRNLAQNLALAEEALGNWEHAAEAWRDMVRRRPRKASHPDYLIDSQVSALWAHAADCYLKTDWPEEAETCFKHAIEYAPDDVETRSKLVDLFLLEGRVEAAENELNRILDIDEDNVNALTRLATLYEDQWRRNPAPLWKRVLELEPDHVEARDAVADHYLELVDPETMWGYMQARDQTPADKIETLKEGLDHVPDHPELLYELGWRSAELGNVEQARTYLARACRTGLDTRSIGVVGGALHELLHVDADEIADEIVTDLHDYPSLLPAFWVHQVQRVLHCNLDDSWRARFEQEAFEMVDRSYVEDTYASVLVMLYMAAYQEDEDDVRRQYEQRIQDEVADSGALEYLEAHRLDVEEDDPEAALKQLRSAKRKAKRARDDGMMQLIQEMEDVLRSPFRGLSDIFGDFPFPDIFGR